MSMPWIDSMPLNQVIEGDCFEVLKSLEDNSFDALLADPPSATGFMNKSWDSNKGGRDKWIAWLASIMSEVHRCLKPGAYGLVWALPRTSHWTAMVLEDAGFIIRDCVLHVQAQGFPKSLDASSALDFDAFQKWLAQHRPHMQPHARDLWKATEKDRWAWRWCELARERYGEIVGKREVVGTAIYADGKTRPAIWSAEGNHEGWKRPSHEHYSGDRTITAPATPEAKQYAGYGSALKPSYECWYLVQKPVEKSIVHNILKYGTGALNIDAARIPHDEKVSLTQRQRGKAERGSVGNFGINKKTQDIAKYKPSGRFPSHLILSEETAQVLDDKVGVLKSGKLETKSKAKGWNGDGGKQQWLGASGDEGGPSRYFKVCESLPEDIRLAYFSKASRVERDVGLEGRNIHSTVKNVSLTKYLASLICPPQRDTPRRLLNPFAGSGSEAVGAILAGWDEVLSIEKEPEYVAIAQARLDWWQKMKLETGSNDPKIILKAAKKPKPVEIKKLPAPLFEAAD